MDTPFDADGYLDYLPPAEFEALHAARKGRDPQVLSVAQPAPAERLPQPHPDAGQGESAPESLREPPRITATALTAGAPLPADATTDRAMVLA